MVVSEFYSDSLDREAHVIQSPEGYYVRVFDTRTGALELIDVREKTLRYAEDTAENFVQRVGKFR